MISLSAKNVATPPVRFLFGGKKKKKKEMVAEKGKKKSWPLRVSR